jgi:hypothetical protein
LKPAGIDYGPVIPAAEEALETGDPAELVALLLSAVERSLQNRFEEARTVLEMTTGDDVPGARERVNAEFAFIQYAESIHAALKAEGHGYAEDIAGH